MLERYNGLGYAARGKPSPYIWSGTDQYVSGKYVRDGVYDARVVDQQPGCAGLLLSMMEFDPTITFVGTTIPARKPSLTPKPPPPVPSIAAPAQGSIGAFFVALFKSLFGRK